MAMEHVWVELDDRSKLRGDQVVGVRSRKYKVADQEQEVSYHCVEAYGSGGGDRFRKICEDAYHVYPGSGGDLIAQLSLAAAKASEQQPYVVQADISDEVLFWVFRPLALDDE